MPAETLVNATDLAQWADRRDAQESLPQILRRLICGTPHISRISFRAHEGVQLSGFDGIVSAEGASPFVPEGLSVWEMGTNREIGSKANEDYKTRTDNPLGIEKLTTALVFITPRRWPNKESWVTEKNAEGHWREVRAYDADDLATWLEQSPAVHYWLSLKLGRHHEDVDYPENFWERWSNATTPSLTTKLILSDRSSIKEEIEQWLRCDLKTLQLQAETVEEALAVFFAVIAQLPAEEKELFLARTVIAQSLPAWQSLSYSENPLILVQDFTDANAVSQAINAGHRVVIPLGKNVATDRNVIEIPSISRRAFDAFLQNAGLSHENAWSNSGLARRSLSAFRRKFHLAGSVHQPTWASASEAVFLVPLLFIGKWNDSVQGDRDVISKLTGRPYEEVRQVYRRWENEIDPPLRRIGDIWFEITKESSWQLLSRFLSNDDFEKFEAVVIDVLSIPDPRFDLPEEKRWAAGLYGKNPQHSPFLRSNLAETLALMGSREDYSDDSISQLAVNWTKRIVRQIFEHAGDEWQIWASLSDLLPDLAEAAPSVFLDAIERGFTNDPPLWLSLFSSDGRSILNSSSSHTGLLWALERVAWLPDYFGRACLLLARLARIDPAPNSNHYNRPKNSLREIFLLWHPQTLASLESRLRVIDLIRSREPEVGWELLKKLIPAPHSTAVPTPKPKWRDGFTEISPISYSEHRQSINEVVSRAIEEARLNGQRWDSIISSIRWTTLEAAQAFTEKLSTIVFPEEEKKFVWESLREFIARCKSHSDQEENFPHELLVQLEAIHPRFEPARSFEQFVWLFTHRTILPDENPIQDYESYRAKLEQYRANAIQVVFEEEGLTGLLQLAQLAEIPNVVGSLLGQSVLAKESEATLLSENLASPEISLRNFALGFIWGRKVSQGMTWIEKTYLNESAHGTPHQRAVFLNCFPGGKVVWAIVENSDEETRVHYWKNFHQYSLRENLEDVIYATQQLLLHQRPLAAVELLDFQEDSDKRNLVGIILATLEYLKSASISEEPPQDSLGYHLCNLLEVVFSSDKVEESVKESFEWLFLPLLEDNGHQTRFLNKRLCKDPKFFLEVICLVYRAKNQPVENHSEQEIAEATHGYKLLKQWGLLPGTDEKGRIDSIKLNKWITEARTLLAENDRAEIGDYQIGSLLSHSPLDENGDWPHQAIREVIEELSSPTMERGFETSVFNSRGPTWRAVDSGGEQERQLVEKYEGLARRVRDAYPRTAAMLLRIADRYRHQANSEDTDSELREALD